MRKMVKTIFLLIRLNLKNLSKKKIFRTRKVFKNYYGSLKANVINKIKTGENVIFDIDWQGTQQIKNKKLKYKILTIFILPPSKKELYERLLKREKKDKKIALERMKQFKNDVMHWKDYDFAVVNDNVEKCYKKITKFIKNKELKKRGILYNKKLLRRHVQKLIN